MFVYSTIQLTLYYYAQKEIMLYHKAILYLKSLTIKVFLLSENQSFKPCLLSQGFSFFTMRHKPLLHNALAIT